MENLVEVRGLAKRYGDFALGRVDLDIPSGYVVGLVGQNGAGKTTVIKSILGLVHPDAGEIRLFGEPISAAQWQPRVGVVYDTCAFPGEARADDVARIGQSAYERWDEGLFRRIVEAGGIGDRKTVRELSRGMGMRLSLAFALAHHPDLLVLDEPTAGLDPIARGEALDLLRAFMEADESRGILLATHITTDLERIADWIVCLDAGRVAFSCAKDDICDLAGIARCRAVELEALAAHPLARAEALRMAKRPYGADVLVPDRFAFERAGLDIACDPADIDGYLELMLKGREL